MAPRIFTTGITGYIAGQLVASLVTKYPDFQVVGLVRNTEAAQKVKAKLPTIHTVLGDLSSHNTLLEEARKADIVVQAADCDDVSLVQTLIKGLSEGKKGGTFIQVSGSASIVDASAGYGQLSTRIYDDIEDIDEITTFDSTHLHWDSDQAVIREGEISGVRTAILAPGMVYGVGQGPVKTHGWTLPWLKDAILKHGKGFTVGEGRSVWAGVHVKDLAEAIVLVLEQALQPNGGKAAWGKEGSYYVESGEFAFGDIVPKFVGILKEKGLIESVEINQLGEEEATSLHPYALMIWGSNSRCRASRLRALGWKPRQPSIFEVLSSYVF
jgi:nucleoside-diphosphate-sugar epimerase